MAIDRGIFVRLLIGAFGLTFLGFIVRGTSTIAFGPDTAELLSAPVFVLAILCAVAGFVLAVAIKLQEQFGRGAEI